MDKFKEQKQLDDIIRHLKIKEGSDNVNNVLEKFQKEWREESSYVSSVLNKLGNYILIYTKPKCYLILGLYVNFLT